MPDNILASLTLFTSFLCMAISLWFAVYLLARSPANPLTFRAVVALLTLAFYYNTYFRGAINPKLPWGNLTSLSLILTLVAVHDLTHYLLPEKKRREWYWLARLIVVLGIIGIVLLFIAPPASYCDPVYICPGEIAFPWIVIDLIKFVTFLAIVFNLWQLRKSENRIFNLAFYLAILLGACSVAYGVVVTALDVRLPRILGILMVLVALVMSVYSVARNRALVVGRGSVYDLPVTLLTISAVVVIYFGWTRELKLSVDQTLLLLVLAIFTHSIYDFVRELLDRVLRTQELTMRRELRSLAREAPSEGELKRFLQRGLAILCHNLHAPSGFIAMRHKGQYQVVASLHSLPVGANVPDTSIPSESGLQNTGVFARQAVWITPASLGAEDLAVVGIGTRQDKTAYGAEEIFWIEDIADEVARMVYLHQRISTSASNSDGTVVETAPMTPAAKPEDVDCAPAAELDGSELLSKLAYKPEPNLVRWVEDCFRNLNDYAELGRSPLTAMLGIEARDHLEAGKRLQGRLTDVIEKLRPPGEKPSEPLPREWYAYTILHDAYVEEKLAREIMGKLYISEGTYFRMRRHALRSVARALVETETSAKN